MYVWGGLTEGLATRPPIVATSHLHQGHTNTYSYHHLPNTDIFPKRKLQFSPNRGVPHKHKRVVLSLSAIYLPILGYHNHCGKSLSLQWSLKLMEFNYSQNSYITTPLTLSLIHPFWSAAIRFLIYRDLGRGWTRMLRLCLALTSPRA